MRAGSSDWHWSGDAGAIAAALRKQGLKTPARITRIRVVQRTESGRAQRLELIGDGAAASPPARSASRSGASWAGTRCGAIGSTRTRRRQVLHRPWIGARRRALPARRGPDGHRRARLSRDSGVLFSGNRTGRFGARVRVAAPERRGVVLYTTRPSQDGPVLAAAERALRDGSANVPVGRRRVGLRCAYIPMRKASATPPGEPGWVAAYTHGTRIEMQPVRDAEKTLRHEMFHLLIESQAAGFPAPLVSRRAGGISRLRPRCGRTAGAADSVRRRAAADSRTPLGARRAYADAAAAVAAIGRGAMARPLFCAG